MNTKRREYRRESGFTLLEIIVTFIIAAFLGSMLIEYLGTSLTRGGESVVRVQNEFSLNGVMENITADFERGYLKGLYDFETFRTNVENGNDSANVPYYGSYEVQTDYITFDDSGIEAPDSSGENRILKVTVRSADQALTVLFRK